MLELVCHLFNRAVDSFLDNNNTDEGGYVISHASTNSTYSTIRRRSELVSGIEIIGSR